MIKVWLVIVLQGLQLDVDGLIPAVLITGPSVRPLMRQADCIPIAQWQELRAAAAATAAGCLLLLLFQQSHADSRKRRRRRRTTSDRMWWGLVYGHVLCTRWRACERGRLQPIRAIKGRAWGG